MEAKELLVKLKEICFVGVKKRWIRDEVLAKNYPDLTQELITLTNPALDLPLRARFEILQFGIHPVCKTCGKLLSWTKYGWLEYCSVKCGASNKDRVGKIFKTKEERYGEIWRTEFSKAGREAALKEEAKLKRAQTIRSLPRRAKPKLARIKLSKEEIQIRRKAACQKYFGADSPFHSPKIQSLATKSLIAKYGGPSAMCDPKVRELSQKTWNSKSKEELQAIQVKREVSCRLSIGKSFGFYLVGCRYAWTPKVRIKRIETCQERYGGHPFKVFKRKKRYSQEILNKLTDKDWMYSQYYTQKLTLRQIAKNLGINDSNLSWYFYQHGFKIDPRRASLEEAEFADFIESLVPIQKQLVLDRKKIDVYIPSKNIAFEYNGLYYHTEEYKYYYNKKTKEITYKNYHLGRTLLCEKYGIRLVHIWSDDWIFKQNLMKRKIRALLGLEERKVFARKCQVVVPSQEQKRKFYQENHIKGFGSGSICYALEFEKELVAMITFKVTSQGHDLNRFATSCSVPGGFSKLLEHFKRNHSWEKIYTFADRSWSQGNVYLKAGFKLVEEQPPTYSGFEGVRVNRLSYVHKVLIRRFPNLKGTQFQIMDQAGIRRIWDCGQLKFELVRN